MQPHAHQHPSGLTQNRRYFQDLRKKIPSPVRSTASPEPNPDSAGLTGSGRLIFLSFPGNLSREISQRILYFLQIGRFIEKEIRAQLEAFLLIRQ
jgi:hypothetical protein